MRKHRGAKTKAKPVVTTPRFVLKAKPAASNPEFLAENEAIAENRPHWTEPHKFVAADWTHPNGHPRCLLCGSEEPVGGTCTPITKDGNTDTANLDGGSTPLHTGTPSFRQRHGVHPYEALLHPPEGVTPGEIVKALIVEGLRKRAVDATIVDEVAKATAKQARREAGTDWLSDYGHAGDEAEAERLRRSNLAPAADAVAAPAVKAIVEALAQQTAKTTEALKELTALVSSPRFKALIRKRLLAVAKHAEAVETLKAVNKDRTVRGLNPFPTDFDVIKHWVPKGEEI